MNKGYLKIMLVPKELNIYSGSFTRNSVVAYLYSNKFFFKYKFNCKLGGLVSNNKKFKVYGSNYAIYNTYLNLVFKLFNNLSKSFTYNLSVVGLGYKYKIFKSNLYFILGYSHLVSVNIPKNVNISIAKKYIIINSFDRLTLNSFFFKLRSIRPLDAYKAKGLRLQDETLIIKKGKQSSY